MPNVFISHTGESRAYVEQLLDALRGAADVSFFDAAVAPGEPFAQQIRAHLKSADYLIVLLTERSANSPWVLFEVGAAEGMGMKVLPVLLADVESDLLDYLGRDRYFLDARGLSPERSAERIRDKLAL